MSQKNFIDTVDGILTHAKSKGIIQHTTEDDRLSKNLMTIEGQKLVNFGSCSYLGLEFEKTVKDAAKSAIDNYGTQFSSSRAYVSPIYYETLESKLSEIFNAPTIVTPTTTLGHIAAIPTIVSPDDAVILDHQVHNSVQTAVNLLRGKKTHIELIRHNRMDLLEKRIIELKSKYKKIWYMADGIYSMFGDLTPLDEIYKLLDKYEVFHFYVDDAHGMSCFGDKGQGYVLANRKIHARMIVATSFAKAFATGGGALIFPNTVIASKVRNCGGPLITSGPMQPSALGAANIVADLHLSGQIKDFQDELNENIKYTELLLQKYGLPNLAEKKSPIFFVAVSLPKVAYKIIDRMKADGFFLNLGIFPAVPIKNTGIRFTITRLHTFKQIADMTARLAYHFETVMAEEGVQIEQVYKAFKMTNELERLTNRKVASLIKHSELTAQYDSNLDRINAAEWDAIFASRGTIDYNSLALLQNTFKDNVKAEQNWDFNYVIIRDPQRKIVLATFLTTTMMKEDIFASADVSMEIEQQRINDPHYMVSKSLSIGCPLTEGNHLYLDQDSVYWKEAMDMFLQKIESIQERENIDVTMLRDLPDSDDRMDSYLLDNGFFKMGMPETCKVQNISWTNSQEFYQTLSKNNKRHYRKNILRNEALFTHEIIQTPSEELISQCYELYLNVKNKSYAINTYTLPYKLFQNFANDANWEIISLYLKTEVKDSLTKKPVAMAICHKTNRDFSFVLAGIDYEVNQQYSCYRQLLSKILNRGTELGCENINYGYTSVVEKKRFGTTQIKSSVYLQVKDNFSMEALGAVTTGNKTADGINKRRVLPI